MLKSSTDIWFCAYLKYKGVPLENYEVIAKNKVRCNFKLSDADWNKLKLEFSNSELIKYKVAVEQVKDLAF